MSVAFEPQQVRRKPRGPEPALIAGALIATFVALAVLRPWQAPAPLPAASPLPQASASPAAIVGLGRTGAAPSTAPPTAAPAPVVGAVPPVEAPSQLPIGLMPLTWAAIAPSLTPADAFGLTVVRRTATTNAGDLNRLSPYGFTVGWVPFQPANSTQSTSAPPSGQPILAIGITAPALETPLDVRIWRVSRSGLQRLTTPAVASTVAANRLLLPPLEDGPALAWLPGPYVAEALVGTSIRRFPFSLPPADARRDFPRIGIDATPLDFDPVPSFVSAALAGKGLGPFTLDAGGQVHTWPADDGPPLDAAGAWLGSAAIAIGPVAAQGSLLRSVGTAVARVWGRPPAVIGVSTPRGDRLVRATLRQLAPEYTVLSTEPLLGSFDDEAGPAIFAAFVAPNGAWPAGTYRIDAEFRDGRAGSQTTSWHLDVEGSGDPSGDTSVAPLLWAAYRWSNVTPTWGVLAPQPLVAQTARATFWPLDPAVPMRANTPGAGRRPDSDLQDCSNAARVDVRPAVFAVNLGAGVVPDSIRLVRAFTGARGIVVATAVASSAVPNVWLVAAGAAAADNYWQAGRYQLEIERAGKVALLQVCIGTRGLDASAIGVASDAISNVAFDAQLLQPGARAWPLLRPGYTPAILGP